ncbi:MAG: MBOAT family O-acyltransferase [Giesbergeria sp.]
MLFNSYLFLFLFLPVALGSYYLLGALRLRWAALWLCFASFVFYGWWNPRFVALLAASILFNYVVSRYVLHHAQQRKRQAWTVAFGVACNLLLLFYYKYFVTLLGALAGLGLHTQTPDGILLPLGISFFTFTQIGYLLDCRAGLVTSPSLLNHTLFVTFFPHLIAGPVLHHKEMMPQFAEPENYRFKAENLSIGGTLFVIGLAKKVLFADSIAPYADEGFAAPHNLQFWGAWATSLAYAMQLYFDFSGYSDMALGLAKMFGIRFPLNFNSPYKAPCIIEYWARWHMTLTRYLTAYLYYPLAMQISRWRTRRGLPVGSVGSRTATGFALMIATPTLYTMALAGVWHGAGLQFFIYGVLHGAYLCVNHGWRILMAGRVKPQRAWTQWLYHSACVLLTFVAVMAAFAFFRASGVGDALALLHGMAGLQGFEVWQWPGSVLREVGGPEAWRLLLGRHLLALYLVLLLVIVWLAPNSHQILGHFSPALARAQEARLPWLRWKPSIAWLGVFLVTLFFCLIHLHRETRFLYFQF